MKGIIGLIVIVAGLWAIVRGGISLLAPDLSWELTQWRNAQHGEQSERTETWARGDRFWGCLVTVIGVGILALAVYYVVAVPA